MQTCLNRKKFFENEGQASGEQEQLHGGGYVSQGKSAGDIRCLCNFLWQMHNKNMFNLENEGKGQLSTTFTMVQFDSEYQPLWSHTWAILASHHIFEIFTFKMCDLENVGQSHDLQKSQ